jgi:hypothetical protein
MTDLDALAQHQREVARWRILKILDAGRPSSVSEQLILMTLNDVEIRLTPHELRRELDYLSDRKLVTLKGGDSPVWSAELTHYGVDIVEYTQDVFPGIARPPRW